MLPVQNLTQQICYRKRPWTWTFVYSCMCRLSSLNMTPEETPDLHFLADSRSLKQAITSFGCISAQVMCMQVCWLADVWAWYLCWGVCWTVCLSAAYWGCFFSKLRPPAKPDAELSCCCKETGKSIPVLVWLLDVWKLLTTTRFSVVYWPFGVCSFLFRKWRMDLWNSGCWNLVQPAVLKLDFRPVARLRTGCFPQMRTRWHTNLNFESFSKFIRFDSQNMVN